MRWRFQPLGELPWGYDMEPVRHGRDSWFLKDPDGNTHESVRELFSAYRLRACACHSEADFEHMRRSLHAVDRELVRIDRHFLVDDVFDGSVQFQRTTFQWLEAFSFAAHPPAPDNAFDLDDLVLTEEGHAVLRMLDETRPGSNIDTSPPALRQRYLEEIDRVHGRGARAVMLFRRQHA